MTPPVPVASPEASEHGVRVLPITQATAATFPDLFIQLTFLCFVRTGSKRILCPLTGEMIAHEGDLILFPSGSVVTLENRPLINADYRADGVYFSHDMVRTIFPESRVDSEPPGIQIIRADPLRPLELLTLIQETLGNDTLPPPIRQHRLLEPLIWLRHHGIRLSVQDEEGPLARLRSLIESDLERPWRAMDAARHFAMSEPTFRRWLARSGYSFAKVLHHTRLENGLALLQNTRTPIAQVALECGFKTPSHFSDSFKKRFGLKPTAIRSPAE